jgi:type V secretory pathway adhesin AidA
MTTKAEAIAAFKLKYPTLRSGDDERGYEDLNPADYEAQIEIWADNQLADEAKATALAQAVTDKAALLAKLGISADEAKLLLS